MQSFIITKWIEPYRLLETIKEFYQYKDFTFDGQNKSEQKSKFMKELSGNNIGLYMKNVNKFYLFSRGDKFEIAKKLIEVFGFVESDYYFENNLEKPFELVDMGRAEAGILLN